MCECVRACVIVSERLSMYFASSMCAHSLRFSLDLIAARCSCHGAAAVAVAAVACVSDASECLRSGGPVRCDARTMCGCVQTWRLSAQNQANESARDERGAAPNAGRPRRSNVLILTDANGNVKHNHCLCNWVRGRIVCAHVTECQNYHSTGFSIKYARVI